ncbi:MAG: hypothetical protein ACXADB_07230 [Candidatus Hermodarchaeia archaeon]|jgi:hypothetical protein
MEDRPPKKRAFIGPIIATTSLLGITLQAIWYALVSFFTGQFIKKRQKKHEEKQEQVTQDDDGWVDPLKSRKK